MKKALTSTTTSASTSTNTRKHSPIGWGLEPAMHDKHDYLVSTGHTANPENDYKNFRTTGATIVRSGLRTRFVNPERGVFDFEDAIRQARAAEDNGIFVYWDLAHYDYPRWIDDPWGNRMVEAFVELGIAFADRLHEEGITEFGLCVWNEILLWASWVAGNAGTMTLEGALENELREKWKNLGVRTTLAVMEAVRAKYPKVKFLIAEPCHRGEIHSFLNDIAAADPVLSREIVIGLNVYPTTDFPHSMDPVAYFVPIIENIRKDFPENEIIFSETSSVGDWGLPDRMTWFQAALEMQRKASVDTMIWYPAINYGAWHDENVLVEHGGWHLDPERTEFSPLVQAVREANTRETGAQKDVQEEEPASISV